MRKIILFVFLLIFFNPVFADPKMELGLDVYNDKAQCGMCHALQAAGSEGQIGPNLDQLRPSIPQVIAAATNGIGVIPLVEETLSSKEVEAATYFVSVRAGY